MRSVKVLLAIKSQYLITPEEILTGEGFSLDKVNYKVDKSEVLHLREPKEVPYDIDELLEDARKILTSKNQAAIDALKRNIRYFIHTIDLETRLKKLEDARVKNEQRIATLEANTIPGAAGDATSKKKT